MERHAGSAGGLGARRDDAPCEERCPGWDYGYQWWLTTRNGADVWAGRGFGGQFLFVIPSRDIVAVVQSWNVFGGQSRNLVNPLLDALT